MFRIFNIFFNQKPTEPVHPHHLMVQWGYIAVIFVSLLLIRLPMAIGSTQVKKQTPISQKEKWEVCYTDQGRVNSVYEMSCASNDVTSRRTSKAGMGFAPDGTDSVDQFLKSLKGAFGG